jgi:hypothetical protein
MDLFAPSSLRLSGLKVSIAFLLGSWFKVKSSQLIASSLKIGRAIIAQNWPCNPSCALCDQHPGSAERLVLHCVFVREVWMLVSQWTGGLAQMPQSGISLEEWWRVSLIGRSKEERRRLAPVMIYTDWNIWKERNRRVFDGAAATPPWILALIIEEMRLRDLACGSAQPGECFFLMLVLSVLLELCLFFP